MVELRPAASLSIERLADLFTAGYEDYYTQLQIDAAAFEFMVRAWDLDLDASRFALRCDEPIGVCMLGVRGDEGWIGRARRRRPRASARRRRATHERGARRGRRAGHP